MKKGLFLLVCLVFGLVCKVEAASSGFWSLRETRPKDTGSYDGGYWVNAASVNAGAASAVITSTPTSGDPIRLSTSWSIPPSRIEPSIAAKVQINLTATLDSIWNQNSHGEMHAFIDVPGLDPGYVTGGATRMTDQNGKEYVELNAVTRGAVMTVAANMPSGSTSLEQKSIYVASSSQGGGAQVEYVYEWNISGPIGTLVTRYRLYSDGTHEHLYTTDINEYNVLVAGGGWIGEGTIYKLFQGAGSLAGVDAVPYYRLYNPNSYQHHWTTDLNEYNVLGTRGWSREGVDGYIVPSAVTGSVPLYRLYLNAFGGLHLWTTDANEKKVLSTSQGWVDEGVAGYVVPLQ